MAAWDEIIPEDDLEIYRRAGWGHKVGLGQKPALMIIDVTYNFCGTKPASMLDAIDESKRSCGASAWDAVDVIKALKEEFEARNHPVVYTTGVRSSANAAEQGRWVDKNPSLAMPEDFEKSEGVRGDEIVSPIAPSADSIVISKLKPSAFFGTPLVSYLQYYGVDSLVICGTTTSGCVRATVLDAFSYNYKISVVEDATFDRARVPHAVNLFDIQQKYGDVVSSAELLETLRDDAQISVGDDG